MARNDGRRVEPGDSLYFDGDAWDVTQVRPEDDENGRVRMVRKNNGKLPIVVNVPVGDVEIKYPDGHFIGDDGRIHGSVSGGLSGGNN